jgi:hypothetical protein
MKVLNAIIAIILFSSAGHAEINSQFFDDVHNFLGSVVTNGKVDYEAAKSSADLKNLVDYISTADVSGDDDMTKQAFYINAYNLIVINEAAKAYPLETLNEISGFFDRKDHTIAGQQYTLNSFEKDFLLKEYKDPRYHFVLVCGALGCPPITNFAYTPILLEQQLDRQTKQALNNPRFIQTGDGRIGLSQIFDWYRSDFGGNKKAVIQYINGYRDNDLSTASKLYYYDYDWAINDVAGAKNTIGSASSTGGGNNSARYIVSSTIAKGTWEYKVFNNLFSQRTGNDGQGNLSERSSFFTTSYNVLYGLSDRFNIGYTGRYRRTRNDNLPSSLLSVFGNSEENLTRGQRSGFTGAGPQIRWAPVKKWANFSIQSQFLFAIGSDLEGRDGSDGREPLPFLEWDGNIWWTQFFNDFPIGNNWSLFTEIDFLIEDLGSGESNRISTPATAIISYNASKKTIFYALAGYSPFWLENFEYFRQFGIGTKYQFTPNLELELLYTDFSNNFLADSGGQAATFNLGLRFNLGNY